MADQVDYDNQIRMQDLVHNTIVADSKSVESSQSACKRLRLDLVQIRNEPMDPADNAPRDWDFQAFQFARSRIQDANFVHGLCETQVPNNIIQRVAVVTGRDILPLAQEPLPHAASDLQTLVKVTQHRQQRPFDRLFHDGLEHLPELRLGHPSYRVGGHP